MRRRTILTLLSGSITSISSGCSTISDSNTQEDDTYTTFENTQEDDTYTTFEEPNASAATGCSKGAPIEPRWSAAGPGPIEGFELSISKEDIEMGESFRIEMENTSGSEEDSGVKKKFDIQYMSDDTWSSIYSTDDHGPLDKAIFHDPGDGFSWDFEATKAGLSDTDGQYPHYYVCGEVKRGTYRFVYWGLNDSKYSLAVPFKII